ncbi:MAG: hypothetical protein HQK58_04745 [Deltaproteobacteria bacterium]|nr:hypothetical protein [Deltaproteobacteria bacterium]
MHHDISSKILIEKCWEEILRRLVGIPVASSDFLEEIPTETVNAGHTDSAIMITDETGRQLSRATQFWQQPLLGAAPGW